MITMDEGVKIPEEDINDKVSLLRASLSTGELPDDLKELIAALQTQGNNESEEILEENEVYEEDAELEEDEEDEELNDNQETENINFSEDVDASIDDLKNLF